MPGRRIAARWCSDHSVLGIAGHEVEVPHDGRRRRRPRRRPALGPVLRARVIPGATLLGGPLRVLDDRVNLIEPPLAGDMGDVDAVYAEVASGRSDDRFDGAAGEIELGDGWPFWQGQHAGAADRPAARHHVAEGTPPVDDAPVRLDIACVNVEGAAEDVVVVEARRDLGRLVAKVIAAPVLADLLQADDVGVLDLAGDAVEVFGAVGAVAEVDIVGDEQHG